MPSRARTSPAVILKRTLPRAASTANATACTTNAAPKSRAAGLIAEKLIRWYAIPVKAHIAARTPGTTRLPIRMPRTAEWTATAPSAYATSGRKPIA